LPLPLKIGVPGSFRIVTLRAGQFGSPIVCDLTYSSYKTGKSQYEALSYVWDDAAIKKTIKVGGQQLHVTENLHTAYSICTSDIEVVFFGLMLYASILIDLERNTAES
jgi:hypothetical protein